MSNILRDGLSANELVLDLLTAHDEHQLSAAALCRAGSWLGIREQSVRVALTRLVQQGKLCVPERGVYALHPGGPSLFEDVRNWLHKERLMVPWNGQWVGVVDGALSAPSRRAAGDHQRALALRGFKALRAGLHVRPDNLHGDLAQRRQELSALGLLPHAVVLNVAELSAQDDACARQLWDVAALNGAYRQAIERLERSEQQLVRLPQAEAAAHTLVVGRQVIRAIIRDPLLPEALCASGPRRALIERMTAYQLRARALWRQALASV